VVAAAQVAELLKICRRREAVVDRSGTRDRGLGTQHAGVGEEADTEGLEVVVLPSPLVIAHISIHRRYLGVQRISSKVHLTRKEVKDRDITVAYLSYSLLILRHFTVPFLVQIKDIFSHLHLVC